MTVQVTDRLSQLYVGNGVNTRFDFTFRIFDQEDETGVAVRIKVGNEFEFLDETKYTVTINPDNLGGYVNFLDAPDAQTYFYIAGKTPVDQLLDITNYDNFYPDAIERALDKLTAILQEWKHLVDFETQARILADLNYDELAQQREADLKAYIDGIASAITGQPVLGLPSKFVVDGDETQEQINDKNIRSFESIADLLAYAPRKHGQSVDVKSYYAGENKGGDKFYYDSTKASINNGITIFNGWVRDLSDKILTTDDAGLKGDGTDTDVTNRLRTFAQLSSRNGFTVQMIGTYYPASNIVFSNAVNLKIVGINSKIEADRVNWTFDGTKRGIIYAVDCPNIVVSNLKGVKGVTLTNYNIALGEARMQDGDAGIQLVRCNNNVVMHNKVSNVKTWGVLTESCNNSTILYNEIFKCLRQSGINSIVNSNSEKSVITHNTIYECGLYGIELETQVASKGKHLVHDNIIYNCQVGISCVGKVFDTSIHDNMITDCYQAFLTVNTNQTATKSERLKIYDNTVLRCAYGYRYSGTWHADFHDNTLDGANVPAYGLTSSYHAVEKLIDSTSFKSIRNFGVGSTIYINDVAYTVTANSSATDTEFGAGTVYTITVNNPLTGVQNGDAIKTPMTVQRGIDAWYLENRYTNVTYNTVRNYPTGYYTQPTMNSNYNNSVSKNRFVDCTNAIESPTDTPGISFLNNEYVRCTNNPIHVNQVIRGQTSIKWFNVENPVPVTAGGTKWTINFNVEDDLFYQAVDLYIFNSGTSSGTIVIQLDGVDLTQRNVSASGTVNALNNLTSIQKLTKGAHTLRIVDTTGAFACSFWRIGFKCI
ncbi:NosD domain-containing protein [Acinetobacter baumannii]|nr:NosD domain-containing protein [Acinetobacter baumannii]